MEQWLWEPSTFKSLLVASGVECDDESIQKLSQQARRVKMDELARQVFYSAVEWEFMTTFDLRGDETIMALTQRLAREYIPHDVPHTTDLGALYHLADANIRDGEFGALYRYIWAEAVAASVFSKCKAAYEAQKQIPRERLQNHLCQPSTWEAIRDAFELPSANETEISVDALWDRFQIN